MLPAILLTIALFQNSRVACVPMSTTTEEIDLSFFDDDALPKVNNPSNRPLAGATPRTSSLDPKSPSANIPPTKNNIITPNPVFKSSYSHIPSNVLLSLNKPQYDYINKDISFIKPEHSSPHFLTDQYKLHDNVKMANHAFVNTFLDTNLYQNVFSKPKTDFISPFVSAAPSNWKPKYPQERKQIELPYSHPQQMLPVESKPYPFNSYYPPSSTPILNHMPHSVPYLQPSANEFPLSASRGLLVPFSYGDSGTTASQDSSAYALPYNSFPSLGTYVASFVRSYEPETQFVPFPMPIPIPVSERLPQPMFYTENHLSKHYGYPNQHISSQPASAHLPYGFTTYSNEQPSPLVSYPENGLLFPSYKYISAA